MNLLIAFLLAFPFLAQLTSAVQLQDAFVKDWISHKYGELTSCAILSTESLLCQSTSDRLYRINVETEKVEYVIDLEKTAHNQFEVAGDLVITYHYKTASAYVWESQTGILIQDLNFDSPIKDAQNFFGLLVVTLADSSMVLISFTTDRELKVTSVDSLSDSYKQLGGEYSKDVFDALSKGLRNELFVADGGSHYFATVRSLDIQVSKYTSSEKTDLSDIPQFEIQLSKKPHDFAVLDGAFAVLTAEDSEFTLEVTSTESGEPTIKSISRFQVSSGKSILVHKPLALSTIEKVHHLVEETHAKTEMTRWLLRVKTHLSQLGRYVTSLVSNSKDFTKEKEIAEDRFGFLKTLVTFDFKTQVVSAKGSSDGSSLWTAKVSSSGKFIDLVENDGEVVVVHANSVTSVSLRTGEMTHSEQVQEAIDAVFKVNAEPTQEETEEGKKAFSLILKSGENLRIWGQERSLQPHQFFLVESEGKLQSFKVSNSKVIPTWKYSPQNEEIIQVEHRSGELTTAIGITRSDRSLLYKYLNPNLVTVVSKTDSGLKITLLDGVAGAVVYVQEHKNESIDFSSVTLLQTDNWLVYAYRMTYPANEQRVVVVDLFADEKTAVGGPKSIADGTYNASVASFSTKSFLFPENILQLQSTYTRFGITTRSILALTESGSLMEIPKYVLNSRRIDDRKMTQEDAEDDFRLSPYEPVVAGSPQAVLNHKQKLQVSLSHQQILVSPTGLESSAIVCFVNEFNDFCTTVQPSSSYDMLSANFDKTKLLITIAILFVAYLLSKLFVMSKKLNDKWTD